MPHLYKQERKRPAQVRRRLSRTQALLGRVIPGGGFRAIPGKVADQCKQTMALCHTGLVKEHDGHTVNQPRLSLKSVENTTVGDQISTVMKTNKHRTW